MSISEGVEALGTNKNAPRKISQVERMAVLGYIRRKFRLFTYTEPAKRFFIYYYFVHQDERFKDTYIF
ncbi:hypothetical protein D3Z46_11870 [Bacteroides sartorii]|nr:hypothetical protein [Phocaeicola sartorii]